MEKVRIAKALILAFSILLLCGGCKDESKIAIEAINSLDWEVAQPAAEKLTDQTLLAEVAKNAKTSGARQKAVVKLTDQAILADIAKNRREQQFIRDDAVRMITDQAILADIAKMATFTTDVASHLADRIVYTGAAGRLTDQYLLADIAKNQAIFWKIRIVAIEKLADQATLADIAKNDTATNQETIERVGLDYEIVEGALGHSGTLYVKPRSGRQYQNRRIYYESDIVKVHWHTTWPVREAAELRLKALENIK